MQPTIKLVKFVSKFNDSVSLYVFLSRALTDAEQEKLTGLIRKIMGSEQVGYKDAVTMALNKLELDWQYASPDLIIQF